MGWRDGEIIDREPPGGTGSWQTGRIVGEPEQQPAYTEEQRRKDFASYKKNLALASEWKKSAESNLPGVRSAAVQMGAGIVSPIARVLGQDEFASQMVRTAAASEQVQQEREKGGVVPDWLQRAARGAGVSLGTAGAAGMFMGPYGIIGTFSAQEGNRAWTEGEDAGLKGKKLAEYVLKQATIEAVPAAVMQRAGLGGMETLLGRGGKQVITKGLQAGAKSGLKAGARQAAKMTALELGEEGVTELGHLVASAGAGVDPEALSSGSILRTLGDTAAQTILTMGFATAPSMARAHQQGKFDKARSAILEAADSGRPVSRDEWNSWGLLKSKGKSRDTRKEGVKEIAVQIREAEATQQTQPVAAEEPTQAPQVPQEAAEATPQAEPAIEAVQPPVAPEGGLAGPTDPTSIANAPVADIRAARGEEPLLTAEPETFEQWHREAERQLAESPSKASRLVEELNDRPRGIDKIESAMLTIQYTKLRGENDAAAQALFAAQKGGDKTTIKRAQEDSNTILGEMRNLEKAAKRGGTEQARGLAARAMPIEPDISLGGVVQGFRVAKGGKELTAKEMTKAKKVSDGLIENKAKQDVLDESIEAQDSEAAVERLIERSKPRKSFKKRSAAKTAEAKEQVKDALADFKDKLAQKGPKGPGEFLAEETGAVDLELVESGARLAVAYANLGVSTFVEFYANVQSSLGIPKAAGRARDSLKAAWKFAQDEGMISKPEVDPNDADSMRAFTRGIVRSLVESGTTELNEVVDAVHEELQAIAPDITRRQAMDAISGYGARSGRTQSEVTKTINGLKQELRKIAEGEDVQATEKKKVAAKIKSLDRAITQIESDLETGDIGPKKRVEGVTSPEIKARQEQLDGLRAERAEQRLLADPKPDPEVAKTAQYKRTLTKRIADLERRITEGDFSKPVKKKTKLDEEATALKFEANELRNRLDAMEEQFRRSQLKGFKRLAMRAVDTGDLARAMKTSMDLSALLRQAKYGVLASYRNPKLIRDATFNMIKSFWSKEMAYNISEELKTDPLTMMGDRAGLSTTEVGGQKTDEEEGFRGVLSQYIPGVAGSERAYVAGLNTMRRGYFKALVESMEAGNAWRPGGKVTDEEAKAIANVVNVFTGRGQLQGKYLSATEFLSTYMFAPRFVTSRFQLALGQPVWGGNARTKKLVAEQYAKAMGGMTVIYSLAAVGGMFALRDEDRPQFEWDPRSSEFGKIRWGDVILDPLAGLGQVVTVISRLVPGFWGEAKYKASTGEIVHLGPEGRAWGGPTWSRVAGKFLQSKLAPIPGAVWNAAAGENIIGEETDAFQEMVDLPIPLSFGDVYDALHAEGYGTKAALATLAIFGDGVNRYQNANAADFARKIALHKELEWTSETTGKEHSYTEAVQQIAAQAKKRGFSESDLTRALDKFLKEAGRGFETRQRAKARLRKRF